MVELSSTGAVGTAGLLSGEGRFLAVCGRTVLAASLAGSPGRRCARCRAAVSGLRG